MERAKIRDAVAKQLQSSQKIQIASYAKNRAWAGKSLDEIAKQLGKEVVDVVMEIESNGGAGVVNFGMSEEDVRMAMSLPWVATASDGGAKIPSSDRPHPRSYGTFSRKVGRYAVEEATLPIEHAIRSCSGLPADILGLKDRGYLRTGLVADVIVLDPTSFRDVATYEDPSDTRPVSSMPMSRARLWCITEFQREPFPVNHFASPLDHQLRTHPATNPRSDSWPFDSRNRANT